MLGFRLKLLHLLLEKAGPKRGVVRACKVARDAVQSARVCELDRVSNIVYLRELGATTARSRRSRSTTPHSDVECVVYDCVRHPALQNFIVIDILVLNY